MKTPEDPDAYPLQREGETQREMLERQIRWLAKQAAGPDGTGHWQMEKKRKEDELRALDVE
jgi:hypothetical protein